MYKKGEIFFLIRIQLLAFNTFNNKHLHILLIVSHFLIYTNTFIVYRIYIQLYNYMVDKKILIIFNCIYDIYV